ncbi:MAG: BppU family phage baseplate upper protein [Nitrospirota bacterium]
MIYLGKYKAGATVKYRANFHNDQGTVEDPTSPEAQLEKPDDTFTFTSLAAPAKVNAKTGHYGGSIDTTGYAAGQYIVRMAGTVSTAKAVATEFCFEIEADSNADIMSRLGAPAGASIAADISTKLATSGYTAPDNTSITAIKTQTDKLQFDVSNYVKSVQQGAVDILQTAADKVWSSATRTLTAFSTSLAVSVWNVLESAISTANSIGLKLKTNLDTTVTSRATQTSVNNIPTNPLLTNDARLDNLDATISSRSTLILADIEASAALLKKTGTSPTNQVAVTADNKVEANATATASISDADKTDIAQRAWSNAHVAERKLTSRNIAAGEDIAREQTLTGNLSTGVLQHMITVSDSALQEVTRGDVKTLTFNLGAQWNLTGRKAYFCMKTNQTSPTAKVNRECTITDAINGICTITLTASETDTVGRHYAEVEVRNADDTTPQTALQFTILITQDTRQ